MILEFLRYLYPSKVLYAFQAFSLYLFLTLGDIFVYFMSLLQTGRTGDTEKCPWIFGHFYVVYFFDNLSTPQILLFFTSARRDVFSKPFLLSSLLQLVTF